jgi:ABC-type glycerol-3-phosphate transport system substrate-binding protein
MKRRIALFISFVTFIVATGPVTSAADVTPPKPPLKVALFGYIPDGEAVEARLQEEFGKLNTGYELKLTLLDPYHDTDEGMPSLQHFAEFDLVETDLCRLDDLRAAAIGLDALPQTWTWYPTADAVSGSAKAVVGNAQMRRYTVPHWICQNFVVRWAGNDTAKAKQLADELDPTQGKPVLGDFWGSTGLGELYATALANQIGPVEAEKSLRQLAAKAAALPQGQKLKTTDLDEKARNAVVTLAGKLPRQFRTHLAYYHNHPEFYAWAFSTNKKAVFVGYSESLFYTKLSEDAASTEAAPKPIMPAQVSVSPLNFMGASAKGTPSWTDGFVIPKGKLEPKKEVIEKFLKFTMTPEAYACFEQPEAGLAAANLMPAFEGIYKDAATTRDEPLLGAFHDSFDASFPIVHSDVWKGMKLAGKVLQGALSH